MWISHILLWSYSIHILVARKFSARCTETVDHKHTTRINPIMINDPTPRNNRECREGESAKTSQIAWERDIFSWACNVSTRHCQWSQLHFLHLFSLLEAQWSEYVTDTLWIPAHLFHLRNHLPSWYVGYILKCSPWDLSGRSYRNVINFIRSNPLCKSCDSGSPLRKFCIFIQNHKKNRSTREIIVHGLTPSLCILHHTARNRAAKR